MPDDSMKQLTREEAIEELIERRLEEWNHPDDTDEALRKGRFGYEEFSNAVLAEIWTDIFERPVMITGTETPQTIEWSASEYQSILTTLSGLLDTVKTSIEQTHTTLTNHASLVQQHAHAMEMLKKLKSRA